MQQQQITTEIDQRDINNDNRIHGTEQFKINLAKEMKLIYQNLRSLVIENKQEFNT